VEILTYEAPGWGVGELWLADGTLVNHELPRSNRLDRRAGRSRPVRATQAPALPERLVAYFAGEQTPFDDVDLDVDGCTAFQLAVVETLRRVPYGETVTYGELAALAGYPNAQRAAGSVCAGNRFPIVVPCHRVVAAGSLGSYGSLGVGYKRRLLELEGVRVPDGRRGRTWPAPTWV
jgi:methylated-DNA-[protein]-cysteine S-methyltransferase